MIRAIDPSPCPSYRGVADEDRAHHLAQARSGVDVTAATERLCSVMDALVEASVPGAYEGASRSLAVDCATGAISSSGFEVFCHRAP